MKKSFFDWKNELLKQKFPSQEELSFIRSELKSKDKDKKTPKTEAPELLKSINLEFNQTPASNEKKGFTEGLKKTDKKKKDLKISEKTLNSIFPVRHNSRLYMNQTALIYQLAKSRLVINMKTKTPIISSNKRVISDRTINKSVLDSPSRSIAKVTLHIINKN